MLRLRVFVSGRVQGVYFRDTTRKEAEARGVAGWVRNLRDGRVEAAFEGDDDAVRAMLAWTRRGPPAARVDEVDVREEPPEGARGFDILPTA